MLIRLARLAPVPMILVCLFARSAAWPQGPRLDPFDTAMQAYWKAASLSRFEEASASRDQARALLESMPADDVRFASRVQTVAQSFDSSGLFAQGRSVLELALSRTSGLPEGHPNRIALLNQLASSWRQDGNLLKSLGYLEQVVAANDAARATPAAPRAGSRPAVVIFSGMSGAGLGGPYQQLADMYQRLGQPEAAAAVRARIPVVLRDSPSALASFYEQEGQIDDAAATYKKMIDQARNPQDASNALQSLANLYARQKQYGDAVSTFQQAIIAIQASSRPGGPNPTVWMRQNLASLLHQAGQDEQADDVYQQAIAEGYGSGQPNSQPVAAYANFLAQTKRGGEGEALLQTFLADHPTLDLWEQSNLLNSLANVARISGNQERAAEYARAAGEKQVRANPPPAGQILIGGLLQEAQSAASGGRLQDAYALGLRALDAAAQGSPDRQNITWSIPNLAQVLWGRKETGMAEELYRRLFGLVESWVPGNLNPLLQVTQEHARYLIGRPDRWNEAPAAIERYSDLLITAHGAGTGAAAEVLAMTIDLQRAQASYPAAIRTGQELIAFQESLTGKTSEPYMSALATLAALYEGKNDPVPAVPLRRQAVAIADLIFPAKDGQRVYPRVNAASTLARIRQFDEAERLLTEAMAIDPRQSAWLRQQLDQIQRAAVIPIAGQ